MVARKELTAEVFGGNKFIAWINKLALSDPFSFCLRVIGNIEIKRDDGKKQVKKRIWFTV